MKSFYTTLWGAPPNTYIPFSIVGSEHKPLNIDEVFQAITARDIDERLRRTRHNTAPGPDGIQRKHLRGSDIRELLRVLFNIILVSKLHPQAWNANRTILIPKQRKDRKRVENYGPLTIGSLICRTCWETGDKSSEN